MFGEFLGKALALPVRLLNVPVKLTERAVEAADEFVLGDSASYRRPDRNALDKLGDAIEGSCEDALDQ